MSGYSILRPVVPVVVVMIAVALSQIVLELMMPAAGAARDAYAAEDPVTEIRFGGAALLSVTSLLLLRGLYLDRTAVRAREEDVAAKYLVTGAVCALVSAFTGAVPGVVVGAATVGAVAWLRRGSADVRGDVARDFRNTGYAGMAAAVLYVGLREAYTTFAQWRYGYGASEETLAGYADDRLAGIVVPLSFVLTSTVALLVLAVVWRHRSRIHEARSVVALSGLATLALGGMSLLYPLAAAGLLVMVAALVLNRSSRRTPVGYRRQGG